MKMVGNTTCTSSSRFETVLNKELAVLSFGQDEQVQNIADGTWGDSCSDDEISNSIVGSAVRDQLKDASVKYGLRTSSPPFNGPGCDSEASRFPEMSKDTDSELLQQLTSRTRSTLPRSGSVFCV
jgi:hypothetical protein